MLSIFHLEYDRLFQVSGYIVIYYLQKVRRNISYQVQGYHDDDHLLPPHSYYRNSFHNTLFLLTYFDHSWTALTSNLNWKLLYYPHWSSSLFYFWTLIEFFWKSIISFLDIFSFLLFFGHCMLSSTVENFFFSKWFSVVINQKVKNQNQIICTNKKYYEKWFKELHAPK